MSDATHVVRNGDDITGVLWENKKLGRVFVLMSDINANFDLEVIDLKTNGVVKHIDLRDFLLEALPVKEEQGD
jgi:hypothetical protein